MGHSHTRTIDIFAPKHLRSLEFISSYQTNWRTIIISPQLVIPIVKMYEHTAHTRTKQFRSSQNHRRIAENKTKSIFLLGETVGHFVFVSFRTRILYLEL